MRGREKVGLPIPGHMVDIPFLTKLSNSWADDATENSDHIACLFFPQTAH